MTTLHDPTKVLMGSVQSSYKEVTNHKGTIAAGLILEIKSDNTIAAGKSTGGILGVSLGKDKSDIGRTDICRKGLRVPVQLKSGVDPVPGSPVYVEDATGLAMITSSSSTLLNGVFVSGRIGGSAATGGVVEGATGPVGTVGVAFIDFPGGL